MYASNRFPRSIQKGNSEINSPFMSACLFPPPFFSSTSNISKRKITSPIYLMLLRFLVIFVIVKKFLQLKEAMRVYRYRYLCQRFSQDTKNLFIRGNKSERIKIRRPQGEPSTRRIFPRSFTFDSSFSTRSVATDFGQWPNGHTEANGEF